MRVCLSFLIVLTACGSRDRGPGSDASTSGDADAAGDSTVELPDGGADDGATDDGATDGSTDDATITPGGCGTDPIDPSARIPRSCRDEPACYDHPLCVAAQLTADDRADYVECGDSVPFDASTSEEICSTGPPFGEWTPEFMCGRASFEGSVRFFCSPDGGTVLLRFSGAVRGTDPSEYYTYYGHDFWSGSGGGSGYSYSVSTPLDELNGDAFVGFEPIERASDGAGGWNSFSVTVYFITGGLIDMSYFIGGGFQVSYSG